MAAKRVDLAIVNFGPAVEVASPFGSIKAYQPPMLQAGGSTPMGAAIELGLDLLEARKTEYRRNGIPYYRPWLFMITDGAPRTSGTARPG